MQNVAAATSQNAFILFCPEMLALNVPARWVHKTLAIVYAALMLTNPFTQQEEAQVYRRYAVFYTPHNGPLSAFGASWLGWDIAHGTTVDHPDLGDLDIAKITDVPQKYGLHGTIKPPFSLATGRTLRDLQSAMTALCSDLQPVVLDGLELTTLGRFLALCPRGDTSALNNIAAMTVEHLDSFRAPLTDGELARRRTGNLTHAQVENLQKWGYPHVMDAFRFHITLTGKLDKETLTKVKSTLQPLLIPLVPAPFMIDSFTLVGQRSDGMFEEIQRYPLGR